MLSKTQISQITSLSRKKVRDREKMFVAEGLKLVEDLISSGIKPHKIFSTQTIFPTGNLPLQLISEAELKKISGLKTPQAVVGIFEIPEPQEINYNQWIVALDDVRDPGNLGTIIRLCDWFGIQNLVCSETSVDCFNPKVIQATMGSIARVNVHYVDLKNFLKNAPLPVYGTFMIGKNIYETSLPENGILVMGNEANGISEEISNLCSQKITIPKFGHKKAESLNVAMATAVFLSEIKRFTEK